MATEAHIRIKDKRASCSNKENQEATMVFLFPSEARISRPPTRQGGGGTKFFLASLGVVLPNLLCAIWSDVLSALSSRFFFSLAFDTAYFLFSIYLCGCLL
jgi:hypothetical protein